MAAAKTIDVLHWDMILSGIYERSCVPFLGAAVNISSAKHLYTGLPLGGELSLQLIGTMLGQKIEKADQLAQVKDVMPALKNAGLDEDLARLWIQNLPRVALHAEVKGADRPFLTKTLRGLLPEQKCEPSHLLKVLAEMPFRLVVTTNFDRLLERAIEQALRKSLAIHAEDLVDARALAVKLRDAPDPLSQHLKARFAADTQQRLAVYDDVAEPPQELRDALAGELDRSVHSVSLYDEPRFSHLSLAKETLSLAAGNPTGLDLLRLNRLLLEEAFPTELRTARKEYKVIVQPLEGFTDEVGKKHQEYPPGDDVLVVYKLHGSFADGGIPKDAEGAGVVITEEDYIQFLTIINEPIKGIPNHVLSKFANSTLLFLGYSLEDWDFRTLYKGVIEQRLSSYQRRTAFAIQWSPPAFWVKYWERKGVVIYNCDIHDFADELERRYKERYGCLSAREVIP